MDATDSNRSEQLHNHIRLTGTPVHLVGEFPPLVNLSFGVRYVAPDQPFLFLRMRTVFFFDRPMAEAKKDLTCHIVVCKDINTCQVDGPGTITSFHCGRVISPVTRPFYAVGFDDGGAGQIFIISRVCHLDLILYLSKARMKTTIASTAAASIKATISGHNISFPSQLLP